MQKVLDFLGSARVAIVLFLVLAVISIFGTVIPQAQVPQFYLTKYGPLIGKIILFFDLNDAYHSWWYVGTLFLFLTNLIICSIKRFSISLKLYKKDPTEVNPENLPFSYKISLEKNPTQITEFISNKLGFKKAEKNIKEGILFYKDINRWAYFSVYIVHFSIIVIIIGALVGAILGYKGYMSVVEGQTSNVVLQFKKNKPIFLDFFLKLNKFAIETYPDGTPKEYISDVVIMDKNKSFNSVIKVNSPLKYKGISIYQASYKVIPEFKIKIIHNGKESFYILTPFSPLVVEDKYMITLNDIGETHGIIYGKITFFELKTGRQIPGVIIKEFPHFRAFVDKSLLQIMLVNIEKVNYISEFQVKKDPGVPVVYIGFILMSLGVLLVYFFEPKTFWIFMNFSEKEKITLNMGAYAKREREVLKLKLEKIANKIKNFGE